MSFISIREIVIEDARKARGSVPLPAKALNSLHIPVKSRISKIRKRWPGSIQEIERLLLEVTGADLVVISVRRARFGRVE